MYEFKGRVAIVTGAASGLGAACACRLSAEGSDLTLADVDPVGMAETAATCRAHGARVIVVPTDVSDQAQVHHLLERTVSELGLVSQLVNAAGVGAMAPLAEETEAMWDQALGVNLKGTFFMAQAVGQHMAANGGGRVVNFASINAKVTHGTTIAYSASKAGVVNLTQSLAKALGRSNVNVNCVCPGWVWTPMMEKASAWRATRDPDAARHGLTAYEEYLERVKVQTALGQPTTPEDIAAAVAFLLSDLARNITGQSINVDSGVVFH